MYIRFKRSLDLPTEEMERLIFFNSEIKISMKDKTPPAQSASLWGVWWTGMIFLRKKEMNWLLLRKTQAL